MKEVYGGFIKGFEMVAPIDSKATFILEIPVINNEVKVGELTLYCDEQPTREELKKNLKITVESI